ncbi:MAG: hypothetical protein AB1714_17965 [Acidobacteriota bacterium]
MALWLVYQRGGKEGEISLKIEADALTLSMSGSVAILKSKQSDEMVAVIPLDTASAIVEESANRPIGTLGRHALP